MPRFNSSRRNLFNFSSPRLRWATNQVTELVLTNLPFPTYTTNGATSINGYGIFTNSIPSGDVYFDVILPQGYSGYVSFLGLANTNTAFPYGTTANYKAWYWSGSWFGDSLTGADPPGPLIADTYRIAVRRSNNTFYIKGSSYASSAIGVIPSGTTQYLMMLTQGGYKLPNAIIVNNGAVYSGSGGLY